jgi:spermidine synthase
LGVALVLQARADLADAIYAERSFYGAVRVAQRRDALGAVRVLLHGRIAHGSQYLSPEERRRPVAYYDSASGVGMALLYAGRAARAHGRRLRVGIVGLGAGTLAAYGEPGDVFRFYEINPAVALVAQRFFTYLADSRARVEIPLGDGRMRLEDELERAGSQRFDVLVVDAFSSDAIPAHLLTVECLTLYLRHLQTDGLLLFHVSNRYVNLRPVIRGLVSRFRLHGMWIVHGGRVRPGVLGSSWMIIARPHNPIFEAKEVADSASGFPAGDPPPIVWTDDRQSLWRVLRFR